MGQRRTMARQHDGQFPHARHSWRRWLGWGAGGLMTVAVIGALARRAQAAPAIDGIRCRTGGPVALHTHQHLAIYDRGRPVPVPPDIGSGQAFPASPCLYGLHTHRSDGLISVESPDRRTYTLGQFFDIWRQPLGRAQVTSLRADVRAYVDGRPYRGDLRAIRLAEHTRITLEIGPPWISPPPYTFPAGL